MDRKRVIQKPLDFQTHWPVDPNARHLRIFRPLAVHFLRQHAYLLGQHLCDVHSVIHLLPTDLVQGSIRSLSHMGYKVIPPAIIIWAVAWGNLQLGLTS